MRIHRRLLVLGLLLGGVFCLPACSPSRMIDFWEPLVRVHDAPQGAELLVFVRDQDSILMDRRLVGEDVRIPQRAVAKILVRRSSNGYVHQNERYRTITDLRIKRRYWRLIEDAFSR